MRVPNSASSRSRGWRMVLATLLLICTGVVNAQSDDGQSSDGDPPVRVARLSYADGDLGLMPAGSTNWNAADVNRPLTNGDKLSSGTNARAELDLGGTLLRINGQSDIGVLNLDEQIGQFELTQGTLNISVHSLDQGSSYEIDTPTLALVIDQPGTFRVDVGSNGTSTTVTVFDGNAVVYGENQAQRNVYYGRSYQFTDSTLNNVSVNQIDGGDAFDTWCSGRDAQYAQDASSTSSQYVSDDVVGAQDLDQYGNWQVDDDYGAVWYPTYVGFGWAPYRFGHWAWIAPWGWTWVDNLPWGFAPYHYGRWAFIRGVWGWLPGSPRIRPVYAPALVAFVGIRAGGPVGWFPLGPHEVYNPWYRASRNYYTGVNVANIAVGRGYDQGTLINNIHNQYGFYQSGRAVPNLTYANRMAPNAFTAVSAQSFASARNVQASQVRVSPQEIDTASMVAPGALQRPTAASFGQPRLVNARPLPAAGFNRQVVAVGKPAVAAVATASLRSGVAASNVRVLSLRPGATNPMQQENVSARPVTTVGTPSNSRPATLPQVPHFESAQQVRQVGQTPNAPSQTYTRPQENGDQERFDAAQRSHEYVPERRQVEPNPSYQPAPQQYYARPEQVQGQEGQRQEQGQHSQEASRPHASAPAAHSSGNQH
jgi:FecR protein